MIIKFAVFNWSIQLLKNPMMVITKQKEPYTQFACGWYFVFVKQKLTRKFRWGRVN